MMFHCFAFHGFRSTLDNGASSPLPRQATALMLSVSLRIGGVDYPTHVGVALGGKP